MDEISLPKRLFVEALMLIVKTIIFLYSVISQPIYYFKHKVYKKQYEVDQVERSRQIDPFDPNSPWEQTNIDQRQLDIQSKIDSYETYDEMILRSFENLADLPCYGYRKVLHEQWNKRPDSDKLFRQVKLSEYNWVTYTQFNQQINAARKGLLLEGIRAGDKVIIYADTRPEWQIASQALIRIGAVLVTMYSTLGVDGITHCVNETEVTHIITQKDKVNKLLRLKDKLPRLKKIIYFEPTLDLPKKLGGCQENHEKEICNGDTKTRENDKSFEHKDVECLSFNHLLTTDYEANDHDFIELEKENLKSCSRRHKDSVVVIMYTSGSTGIPKGVLMSHRNLMSTCKSFTYVTRDFIYKPKENVCSAYLPLAHIFEFCIESLMLYHGVPYGFATPHTLTDKSPGLLPGQKGDLTVLKPTVMIIVPLILDRVVQGVKQALKSQSYFKQQLITYLIQYKMYWQKKHYETPLVDKIVCTKIAQALGGNVKYVICGSAPLSGETQSFVRAAFNLKLPQGFGTTETCAASSCQLFEDQTTCNVGLPLVGTKIKLEPWIEGNYRPTDKPHPRGEIVIGGDMIAQGYFKLDEQTKEVFYVDDKGTRWYRTGDIGEFLPNGNLKVIDRKKDLVKLQNGEYVSLGKIEATLKSNPYTDNFCVYANSKHNYVVALGPANEAAIKSLAQQLVDEYQRDSPSLVERNEERRALMVSDSEQEACIRQLNELLGQYEADKLNNNEEQDRNLLERKMSSLSTNSNSPASCMNERLNSLCQNRLIQVTVLTNLRKLALERNLMTLEIPKKVLLLAEEWTEDKNLVTAAMKIRRNYIYKRYEKELEQLYSDSS